MKANVQYINTHSRNGNELFYLFFQVAVVSDVYGSDTLARHWRITCCYIVAFANSSLGRGNDTSTWADIDVILSAHMALFLDR